MPVEGPSAPCKAVKVTGRLGPGSFRPGSFRPGSFRPESFRPWVVSANLRGSFWPDFSQP